MSSPASEWEWIVEEGPFEELLGGCVVFARGVSERDMIAAYGLDPDSARLMTADQVFDDPIIGQPNAPSWVRVARVGDWTTGLEWLQLKGTQVVKPVSKGTEALCISVTITTPGDLEYYVDGVWTTSLGIWEPYDSRAGVDPNRFHEALVAAGLGGLDDGTLDDERDVEELIVGVMDMLTVVFGIRLPRLVYEGPLLTACGTQPYEPGNWRR